MTFADDLKKAKAAKTPSADVPVMVGGAVHVFRFSQMGGLEWASETDKFPPRLDTAVDSTYGYNIRDLTRSTAPLSGVRVEGDREVPVSADEWDALFDAISGHDFQKVTDAIWSLNEYNPQAAVTKAMDALKKAQARSSKEPA